MLTDEARSKTLSSQCAGIDEDQGKGRVSGRSGEGELTDLLRVERKPFELDRNGCRRADSIESVGEGIRCGILRRDGSIERILKGEEKEGGELVSSTHLCDLASSHYPALTFESPKSESI